MFRLAAPRARSALSRPERLRVWFCFSRLALSSGSASGRRRCGGWSSPRGDRGRHRGADLNLKDHLWGVGPNELSPGLFPQIEALKAQAVAARTYAMRNMGQYKDRGYDICATPACQVYRGFSTEHPLTDQAIAETAGVAARYRGELDQRPLHLNLRRAHRGRDPTSFPSQSQAYLKGVACLAERDRLAVIRSNGKIAQLGPEPAINRDVARPIALDVLGRSAENAAWLARALLGRG